MERNIFEHKVALLIVAIIASFAPVIVLPITKATTIFDLHHSIRHLPGVIPVFTLAIALSLVAVRASKTKNPVLTVIKFSAAVSVSQYLLLRVGLWLLPQLDYFQINKAIFSLGLSFLNGFLFAILVRPILKLPLGIISSFAVGAACLIALMVCISQGYHWFWRFVVVGLLSTFFVAVNLTSGSRSGTAQSAAS